jgi:hypothetical protein
MNNIGARRNLSVVRFGSSSDVRIFAWPAADLSM